MTAARDHSVPMHSEIDKVGIFSKRRDKGKGMFIFVVCCVKSKDSAHLHVKNAFMERENIIVHCTDGCLVKKGKYVMGEGEREENNFEKVTFSVVLGIKSASHWRSYTVCT